MPTYRGVPVLDWIPDASSPTDQGRFAQVRDRLVAPATPLRDRAAHQPRPRTGRRLRYVLDGREAIEDAREFITQQSGGRLNGFWVPSWYVEDLVLAEPVADDDTAIVVRGWNYTDFYAGEGLGREHLALYARTPGAAPIPCYRKVESAERNEDGTETLTLDSALGVDAAIDSLVSGLHYARLDDDRIVMEWHSMNVAVIELPIVDVPLEAP